MPLALAFLSVSACPALAQLTLWCQTQDWGEKPQVNTLTEFVKTYSQFDPGLE